MACAASTTLITVLNFQVGSAVESNSYISIMIDGATDSSVKENEAIICRYLQEGKPVNRLLGLLELEHAHADGKHLFCL